MHYLAQHNAQKLSCDLKGSFYRESSGGYVDMVTEKKGHVWLEGAYKVTTTSVQLSSTTVLAVHSLHAQLAFKNAGNKSGILLDTADMINLLVSYQQK